MEALALSNKEEVEGRRERERERERRYFQKKKKKRRGSKDFFAQLRKLGERQITVWTFQGGDTLVTSSSGLVMRFGKVSWTKFMVTISGQRTFAPS